MSVPLASRKYAPLTTDALCCPSGITLQLGNLNISKTLQDWSCSSGCAPSPHCRLPRCSNVVFPNMFGGSGTVSAKWDWSGHLT